MHNTDDQQEETFLHLHKDQQTINCRPQHVSVAFHRHRLKRRIPEKDTPVDGKIAPDRAQLHRDKRIQCNHIDRQGIQKTRVSVTAAWHAMYGRKLMFVTSHKIVLWKNKCVWKRLTTKNNNFLFLCGCKTWSHLQIIEHQSFFFFYLSLSLFSSDYSHENVCSPVCGQNTLKTTLKNIPQNSCDIPRLWDAKIHSWMSHKSIRSTLFLFCLSIFSLCFVLFLFCVEQNALHCKTTLLHHISRMKTTSWQDGTEEEQRRWSLELQTAEPCVWVCVCVCCSTQWFSKFCVALICPKHVLSLGYRD